MECFYVVFFLFFASSPALQPRMTCLYFFVVNVYYSLWFLPRWFTSSEVRKLCRKPLLSCFLLSKAILNVRTVIVVKIRTLNLNSKLKLACNLNVFQYNYTFNFSYAYHVHVYVHVSVGTYLFQAITRNLTFSGPIEAKPMYVQNSRCNKKNYDTLLLSWKLYSIIFHIYMYMSVRSWYYIRPLDCFVTIIRPFAFGHDIHSETMILLMTCDMYYIYTYASIFRMFVYLYLLFYIACIL